MLNILLVFVREKLDIEWRTHSLKEPSQETGPGDVFETAHERQPVPYKFPGPLVLLFNTWSAIQLYIPLFILNRQGFVGRSFTISSHSRNLPNHGVKQSSHGCQLTLLCCVVPSPTWPLPYDGDNWKVFDIWLDAK